MPKHHTAAAPRQAAARRRTAPQLKARHALLAGCAALSFSSAAMAQNGPPSIYRHIDENGMNMLTHLVELDHEILSIGHGPAALRLRLIGHSAGVFPNFEGRVLGDGDKDTGIFYNVYFEHDRNTFPDLSSNVQSDQGDGATLTATSTEFIWTKSDGTVVVFQRIYTPYGTSYGIPVTITYPGGHQIRLVHKFLGGVEHRVQSVTNNLGHQLRFTYSSPTGWNLTSAQAINTAVDYCDPQAETCSGLTQAWPTVTISRTNESTSGANVITVTTPLNETLRYSYTTPAGGDTYRLTGIKEPGRTQDNITYAYNGTNGTTTITVDGVPYSYSYGVPPSGTLEEFTRTGPLGDVLAVRPTDGAERIAYIRDGLNRITNFTYDPAMRLKRVTHPEGNYTEYDYDSRGNIKETRRVAKPGSGLADIVTSATYAQLCSNALTCNKPLTTTDERGQVTEYSYDPNSGLLTSIKLPAATAGAARPETRYGYDAFQAYYKNSGGSIVASGSPVSLLTSVSACQTAATCTGTADEIRTTIGYGPQTAGVANNLLPVSTTTGHGDGTASATKTATYDVLGNPVTVDGPLPGTADTVRLRHDAGQRLVGRVGPDPDGGGALKHRAERYTYNGGDQITAVERGTVNSQSDSDWAALSVLERVETSYDVNGRETSERLVAGGTTYGLVQIGYDALGRVDCTAQRMNPAAYQSLPSSACSPTAQGAHGPDRISKSSYDAAGRQTKLTTGYNSAAQSDDWTQTFTVNGAVESVTDAEGNRTGYEYDGHDRLKKTFYPTTAKGALASSSGDYEELFYSAASDVAKLRNRAAQEINFSRDNHGQITGKDLPNGAVHEVDISYTYDLLGRLTSATDGYGYQIGFTYDAHGRVKSRTGGLGTLSYQHDAAGRRTRITHPDGFYADYDHLLTGEVHQIRENGATSGLGVLATYAYDDLGRRTKITRGNGTVTDYAYDPASRLGTLSHDLAGTANDLTLGFTHDAAGGVVTNSRSNSLYSWNGHYNVNRPYATNGLNQYTQSGTVSPTYDTKGNVTSAGSTSYGYTAENKLATASTGGNFGHDPLGRLYLLTGEARLFSYDGANLVAEYDHMSPSTLKRRYVHGPGMDEPLVWYEIGTTNSLRRWFHADERGSIVATSIESGSLHRSYTYDEYGIPGANNVGRFQYTGQTWLPSLGMYSYKARIYSPSLGRFLQPDPIGYGDGMNLYDYVRGDPVNGTDPSGTETVVPGGVVTGTRIRNCVATATHGLCISPDGLPGLDEGIQFADNEKGDPTAEPRHKTIPPHCSKSLPGKLACGNKHRPKRRAGFCGSGSTEWMVPDQVAGASFRGSCAAHDNCYASSWSQKDCDAKLYADMKADCARQSRLTGCYAAAVAYLSVLRMVGFIAYEAAQRDRWRNRR